MRCVKALLLLPQLLVVSLLLISNARAAVVEGFWSVDCGSAVGFTDPTTNLTWEGDGNYVQTGESHSVPATASLSRSLDTLRAFPPPWPRKNCFTFYFDAQPQILVRAYFYYGNYDGLGKPPSFNLQFDGNPWRKVVTTMDSLVTHQVVYVTNRKSASICVSRTDPRQHPFVSAIEVRTLTDNMYSGTDSYHALFVMRSAAFGAVQPFRYPDDHYDRIWNPTSKQLEGFEYTFLKSNLTSVNTSTSHDDPPERLFKNAAIPLGGANSNLTIKFTYLPPRPIKQIYYNLYYTEISEGSNRSLNVYLNHNEVRSIAPVLGDAGQLSDLEGDIEGDVVIDLVSNESATLPPIVCGLEVFVVSDPLSNGTNPGDVDTTILLKSAFKVLNNWTGDPCLPEGYNWEWIGCRSEEYSARITELLLGDYGLSGDIPDVTSLDALETIDLHGNNFSGSIPEFLGNLTKLTVLNLAYNDFTEIPESLQVNKDLLLNYTGNPKLCKPGLVCVQKPQSPPGNPSPIGSHEGSSTKGHLLMVSKSHLLIILFVIIFSI